MGIAYLPLTTLIVHTHLLCKSDGDYQGENPTLPLISITGLGEKAVLSPN
jgi:hypothetical protein